MRRASVVALFPVLISLLAVPVLGASGSSATPAAATQASRTGDAGTSRGPTGRRVPAERRAAWAPPDGAMLSNPTRPDRRKIVRRILRAVRATNKGHFVRIAVWNFADRHATDALIRAKKRGVRVQVITAESTDSRPWRRLKRFLNRNRRDRNWAKNCNNACRSRGPAMHMKFALFTKVNWKKHVAMVGSWNLTKAAGNRQWNDLVTESNWGLWKSLRRTFAQLRRDRNFAPHPTAYHRGRFHLQLWPTYRWNPIANHLRKVGCWSNGRRTRIRIAIAGWFDSFGQRIANVVRNKWDHGCNIRILTTLAGRGINRTLKARYGRGPVPIKKLTVCCRSDGVPSKYLHMKAIAINGQFGRRERTNVLLTGSPNWSTSARRTDENVVRIHNSGRMVRKYIRRINHWYRGSVSHRRSADGTRSSQQQPDPRLRFRDDLPEWFELQ